MSIIVFEPSFISRSSTEVAQQAASKPTGTSEAAADCSDASSKDYACYQQRYQGLVRNSGAEAAFTDLKDEYKKDDFIKLNCHQLTHVIGRAALDLYGDVPTAYGHGDEFCAAGYYHGAMEALVAKLGPEKVLDEADTLCANFREGEQLHSYLHRNCVHGLGHGFMAAEDNELFESLQGCDALTDDWEREHCYNGVFMQNVMGKDDPNHPSKYLKADQPFYPCTDLENRYKDQCYKKQTAYVLLQTQGGGFAKVLDLCTTAAEEDFRPSCYQGVGWDAASGGINGESVTQVAPIEMTNKVCTMGADYEVRSNCVTGAVKEFIQFYNSDTQAKKLCESFNKRLQDVCLQASEEYYKNFQA